MKNKRIIQRRILVCLVLTIIGTAVAMAQGFHFATHIVDTRGKALEGAVAASSGAAASVYADAEGKVEVDMTVPEGVVTVACEGYFPATFAVSKTNVPSSVVLIPEDWVYYSAKAEVAKKDMQGATTVDDALRGMISGLQVVQKSGMPAEGAYFNIGGIHTLEASNTPLIVLDGVPYMKDESISTAINGYSRSLFSAFTVDDIRSIKVLTGAEAARYGSLGSNGVIYIETEQATSDNLETRISFSGQYGAHFKGRSIDVLDAEGYKNYLRNVGMTRYPQIGLLQTDYPFLQTSADYPSSYIFNNNTDWQSEIYRPAFLTDNVFRVEGGDEIAKYNMSVGYASDGGVIRGTRNERYHTLLNSNIAVSRKVDIFTSVGLAYVLSNLQEQGMSAETNPMLAAWHQMPVLSPFFADTDGRLTGTYAQYDVANVNDYPLYAYENVSNPTAIVNTLEAGDKMYDVNVRLGLNYQLNSYLRLMGQYNLQYRYTEENMFIPGMSNQAIYPQYYGIGKNTVRKAVAESRNDFFNIDACYSRTYDDIHELQADLGARYMSTSSEYDLSTGYNTANDFYKTLDKTTDEEYTDGYNELWRWANVYAHAGYTWQRLISADANLVVDGSSVSGLNAPRWYLYPSGKLTFMAASLASAPEWMNKMNLNVQYSLSGNSRFSSNYAKNYYTSSNFFSMGSIIRGDIPNTMLRPEKQRQLAGGIDISLFGHRVQLGADAFVSHAWDLVMPQKISSVFATSHYFENAAAVSTRGITFSARFTPVENETFNWTVGGTVTTLKSIVDDLGENDVYDYEYGAFSEGDGCVVRLQVGEEPYQFYGYQTDGIYQTSAKAKADNYVSINGTHYGAGDVRFVDHHPDGVINEQDKVLLGSTRPDAFGSAFTSFRFRQLTLTARFDGSLGGKIYNAVRRSLESMDAFHNQSVAVVNRWQVEGQDTDMPRANYGDPNANNAFSDRFVEDGSYVKLGTLMLSYDIRHPLFKLFRSGSLWVSGDNLFTLTKYLGNDPEFAYSYDNFLYGIDFAKVAAPRTVKAGFVLNF
ncbi:MAG: SusC/RagA family TonB-linked outer membrane protein [Bacteroidaceae bacterium]|nr:SusC/RagA family TonB-linked outer membrane protein [Bacteroidaceae bacterium]